MAKTPNATSQLARAFRDLKRARLAAGRSESAEERKCPTSLDKRVERALELLEKSSLSAPMPLSDIAASVHMSSSHLRHLIKREVGMSASHYVKMLRLRRARELLESSFLSVKEVMASVGMNDISHFVREYKSVFGCTPSQSRSSTLETSKPGATRNSR